MKKKLSFWLPLVFAAAFGQLAILPARAEWQYTEWGMSVEEIKQASDGVAVPVENPQTTDNGQKTLLKTDWNSGSYQFEVLFNFIGNQPQLSEVVLIPQGNTEGLVDELKKRFGAPTRAVGELRRTSKSPSFSLVDSETFTRPANPPESDSPPISVLVEWETPSDFIQLIRQSPSDAMIRIQPVQQ
ncbi:hypothetical protein [Myxosarcina sp. GI1(2024)]